MGQFGLVPWVSNLVTLYCICYLAEQSTITVIFITSLAKEVMFLVALVCLFVRLPVDNITQKVINGLE